LFRINRNSLLRYRSETTETPKQTVSKHTEKTENKPKKPEKNKKKTEKTQSNSKNLDPNPKAVKITQKEPEKQNETTHSMYHSHATS